MHGDPVPVDQLGVALFHVKRHLAARRRPARGHGTRQARRPRREVRV